MICLQRSILLIRSLKIEKLIKIKIISINFSISIIVNNILRVLGILWVPFLIVKYSI